MWYVRDVLYAVLYVRVSCFVGCGCAVSRRYIDICYCDMFSVVNVYHNHLKFCIVCINSRRYVCCSECDVVSNETQVPFEGVHVEAYKGTRRKHNMIFTQIGHTTSQYGQLFFPKTIRAWNGLAFAEALSLAVFRSNFLNN